MDMQRAAAAIRQIESSGNYSALGPVVKKGSYKGDRAYGAYQVMGKNVGPWTREVFGREMTPAEFLADKGAQDRLFQAKFGQAARKHGSLVDAASVWHSGRPLKQAAAAGATDGYTRTQDYASRFANLVQGNEQMSARAQQGYSTGMPDEMTGQNAAANEGAQAGQFPDPAAMKRAATEQSFAELARLRQEAAQNARFGVGQSTPIQPIQPRSKVHTAQPIQSSQPR